MMTTSISQNEGGRDFDYIDIDRVPRWAASNWFKQADLDSYHQLFVTHHDAELSANEVPVRREAFRRRIGAPTGKVISIVNTSGSSLLDRLPTVMARFYGEHYDPDNPAKIDAAEVAVTSRFVHLDRQSQSLEARAWHFQDRHRWLGALSGS
jgi:hypothetical protein